MSGGHHDPLMVTDMRTVKEILKEADRDELITAYNFAHPINVFNVKDKGRTVQSLIDGRIEFLNDLMDRLISMPDLESEYLLYAVHRYEGADDEIDFILTTKDRLTDRYGMMADSHENIANYRVAETYTTKYYLIELMVHVLFEASWFGPEQEKLDAFIESLDEEDKLIEHDEVWGWEIRKPDEEDFEDAVRKKIADLMVEYNDYCKTSETEQIKKLLEGES